MRSQHRVVSSLESRKGRERTSLRDEVVGGVEEVVKGVLLVKGKKEEEGKAKSARVASSRSRRRRRVPSLLPKI